MASNRSDESGSDYESDVPSGDESPVVSRKPIPTPTKRDPESDSGSDNDYSEPIVNPDYSTVPIRYPFNSDSDSDTQSESDEDLVDNVQEVKVEDHKEAEYESEEEPNTDLACEDELEWDGSFDSDMATDDENPSRTSSPSTPDKKVCFDVDPERNSKPNLTRETHVSENGSIVELDFAPRQKREFKIDASTFLDTLWKCTRLDDLMNNYRNIVSSKLEKKNGTEGSELILTVQCLAENSKFVWAITEKRSLSLRNNGDYQAKVYFTATRSAKQPGTRVSYNRNYDMTKTPYTLRMTRDFDAKFLAGPDGKVGTQKLLFTFNDSKNSFSFLKMKFNMVKLKKSGNKPDLDDFFSHEKLKNFIKSTRNYIRTEITGSNISVKQALLGE
ncbi:hypothetical protein [Carp edema virus]|nr:hypothetical protein [Carp edema virus]